MVPFLNCPLIPRKYCCLDPSPMAVWWYGERCSMFLQPFVCRTRASLAQCGYRGQNFWWILGQGFSGFLPHASQNQAASTMGQGRRAGCGMKLLASSAPIASPHSGIRRQMSLLKCSGGGLSAVEVSAAGRSDGEEGLP